MDLVSIVIPCYNPSAYLQEAVSSARAQTYPHVEIILVDDGTSTDEGSETLRLASRSADLVIEQPNRGLPAARNAGFSAAKGAYVIPLDADDRIDSHYAEECLNLLRNASDAAFAYSDCRVFGDQNYVERLSDYNLYGLLDHNTLVYAAMIRRQDWDDSGGYTESMILGYEDWDFWLKLGTRARYGCHLSKPLFHYRKHGPSLLNVARAHHEEIVSSIHSRYPELFGYDARARIKAKWAPAVCVTSSKLSTEQTILDIDCIDTEEPGELCRRSRAPVILKPANGAELDAHSAEIAALAAWGGQESLRLADGSAAATPRALAAAGGFPIQDGADTRKRVTTHSSVQMFPLQRLRRHLVNSELLSFQAWVRHPFRSFSRLIPLRAKENVNRLAGRPIFDLRFYLRFRPKALYLSDRIEQPLEYMPRLGTRRRVALITPNLGSGGAEQVLLDIAGALDRTLFETFVIATQSNDSAWLARWVGAVDHVYDLARFVPFDRAAAAIYSLITNWQYDAVLIQNSLVAYTVLPHLKQNANAPKVLDLIHSIDSDWNVASCASEVNRYIDARLVVSNQAFERLQELGIDRNRIWLIRSGIDVGRFHPAVGGASGPKKILFAARLDPVKRPLLTVDIALALRSLRPAQDFRIVVAGHGPEDNALMTRIRQARVESLFEFLGEVRDLAPVMRECQLLLVTSRNEGVPLVVLEALASAKPVVASNVGAISEVVVENVSGILIDPGAGEVNRFAHAISHLFDNERLCESMGAAGRRRIEEAHDRRQALSQYRAVFDSLVNHG